MEFFETLVGGVVYIRWSTERGARYATLAGLLDGSYRSELRL